MVKASQKLMLL